MKASGFTMRHISKPLVFLVSFFAATAILAFNVFLPKWIGHRIPLSFQNHCNTCRIDLGEVQLRVFPFQIVLKNPHLVQGDPKATEIDARASKLVARVSFFSFFSANIQFQEIRIESLKVVVTEGDIKYPPNERKADDAPVKFYSAKETIFVETDFIYRRVYGRETAALHLQHINGKIGEWGTNPPLKLKSTHAEASGLLEGSGRFSLKVDSPVFSEVTQADVSLEIHEQNLTRINPFFSKSDGIHFQGKLARGQTSLIVREKTLKSWVRVNYTGLNIRFEENRDRGALSALLSNFAKSVKMRPDNSTRPHAKRESSLEIRRDPNESLLHFIFRGMKLAALQIVMT